MCEKSALVSILSLALCAGCVGTSYVEASSDTGDAGGDDAGHAVAGGNDAGWPDVGRGCLPGCTPGEMIDVPANTFWMGCYKTVDAECEYAELPQHKVALTAFSIDRYEVTVGEFLKCVLAGVCHHHFDDGECLVWSGQSWVPGDVPPPLREPYRPMVCVSWSQAENYCFYKGKRLPTEAEWELSARGTGNLKYPWGNSPRADCAHAVMSENTIDPDQLGCGAQGTLPIGSRPDGKSPFGVEDMIGNVWEWASDWFQYNYFETSPGTDPQGPDSGYQKVVRGGGWATYALQDLRAGNRHGLDPLAANAMLGFRCAR